MPNNSANLNVERGQCINDRSVPCKTAPTLPWYQCEAIRTLYIPSNKTGILLGCKNVSSLKCPSSGVIDLFVPCRPSGAASAGRTVQSARINISSTRADAAFTKIETKPKADRKTYCFVAQTKATPIMARRTASRFYVVI